MKIQKRIKRILIICFAIVIVSTGLRINVKAAVFGVSAVDNGNGTTTVTISGNCVGSFSITAGSASAVVGKTTLDSNASTTLSTGAGTFTVNIQGTSVSDASYNLIEGQTASTTVTVTSPTVETPSGGGATTPPSSNTGNSANNTTDKTSDADENKTDESDKAKTTDDTDATNKLTSLKVSVGKLSPKFKAKTLVYDVNVPSGTAKITIKATAASSNATIDGLGEKDLIVGDNAFEIICHGENGTSLTYTLRVHVLEEAVATMNYGNKSLGLLSGGAVVSNLFEEQKIKVNGKEVSAWVNTKLNMTLLYMQNQDTGEKDLYMYDTKKNEVTSIYRPFAYNGKNLVMIDVPKNLQSRKGMKYTTVSLKETVLPGWTFQDKAFQNYALIYVMDELGNTRYYQYDKEEDSLQLFSQAAALTQSDYENMNAAADHSLYYWIAIAGLGILSISFLITTIVFYRKRNTSKYRRIDVDGNTMSAEAKSLLHKVD